MLKLRTNLLVLLVTAVCFAQTASEIESASVNRVAGKLNCSCGCNLSMTCLMPPQPCPVCRAAKLKILAMQTAGKSDGEILNQFVAENGKGVLVVEPGIAGVVGPYAALASGLLLVGWTILRYLRKRPAAAEGVEIDAATLDKIEKDMAKLE
jgi:cytochrome c-type biogenesis protein CcmH/NrfF